jgi:hypothetical protein
LHQCHIAHIAAGTMRETRQCMWVHSTAKSWLAP